MVRLRQVALVARALEPVAAALQTELGLEEPYRDPGVAEFGLENVVFAGCYSGAIVCASSKGEIRRKFRVHENAVKAMRLHPFKPMGTSPSSNPLG